MAAVEFGDLRIDLGGEEIGGRELVARVADRRRLLEHGVGEAVVEAALIVGDPHAGTVEVGERSEPAAVAGADHHQLAVAHIRPRKGRDTRPLIGAPHARHGDIELVGGEVRQHRAEVHLDVFDPHAERRSERLEQVDVDPFEPPVGVAHAEDGRIHGGADPEHAGGENPLQSIGGLRAGLGHCKNRDERSGEKAVFMGIPCGPSMAWP